MRFKAKKSYGNYKTNQCPFCQRTATKKNEQGLDVCHAHVKSLLPERKCHCGNWLDVRAGKYGPYFNCIKCGNVNFKKGMETSKEDPITKDAKDLFEKKKPSFQRNNYYKKEKKEITITSHDIEYFD